jgi:hypothetical protein
MRCCFSPEDFPFLDRALEQVCNQLRDMTGTSCNRERIARAVLEQASGGERNLAVIVTSVVESITSPERAGVVYDVRPTGNAWQWEVRTVAGDHVVEEGHERTSIDARAAALEAAIRFRRH